MSVPVLNADVGNSAVTIGNSAVTIGNSAVTIGNSAVTIGNIPLSTFFVYNCRHV
jgi:hypothetical protein